MGKMFFSVREEVVPAKLEKKRKPGNGGEPPPYPLRPLKKFGGTVISQNISVPL
jgi:hypothetical protein